MPGEEIIVGKIVKEVASAAAAANSEDDSVSKSLMNIAKDTPQMKQAAGAFATRMALKQSILLKLYSPFARFFGVRQEYFAEQFASDMAEKTAEIPEENLRTPPTHIAIPAMQGLAISLEEPNLKEMYLNLLAAATDDRRADEAHPSYAEIIRQLSPDEAALLQTVLSRDALPIVRIKGQNVEAEKGFSILMEHILDWTDSDEGTCKEVPLGALFVENWIRLGLVTVDYGTHLIRENAYSWVEARPEYQRISTELETQTDRKIAFDHGSLRRTTFGLKFSAATSS